MLMLTGVSLATSYTVHPISTPISVPVAFTTTHKRQTVFYDLGLGKNKPVYNRNLADGGEETSLKEGGDVWQATQYLVEHETIVDYPRPLQSDQRAIQNNKKSSHPIIPSRFSDDILKIVNLDDSQTQKSSRNDQQAYPVAWVSGQSRPAWDLNTPWVEMLIHEQQIKLALN